MNILPVYLNISLRVLFLLAALAVSVLVMLAGARIAMAASLKTDIVLQGDVFTAGDIFNGIDADKAARVLGPSPRPGDEMVLNARTLMQVASALDLPWQPHSTADQITLRRAATVVGTDAIIAAVNERVMDQLPGQQFTVALAGGGAPDIILPEGQPATVDIVSFDFDPLRDTFQAKLAAPSKSLPLSEMTVLGKVERLTDVPVLKNPLRKGDIIGKPDIEWITIKSRDVPEGALLDVADIEGLTPRRGLDGGKPLRFIDLERPVLVGRGDAITIIFKSGPLTLTAQGKSLQPGAHGDLVRVVNTASNRSIEAMVSGDRQVTVTQ